jgi:hypothetical protein
MTHDELLARIAKLSITPETNVVPSELATALMTVVELHRCMIWKNLEHDTQGYKCQECEGYTYPCSTIEAIKKELS